MPGPGGKELPQLFITLLIHDLFASYPNLPFLPPRKCCAPNLWVRMLSFQQPGGCSPNSSPFSPPVPRPPDTILLPQTATRLVSTEPRCGFLVAAGGPERADGAAAAGAGRPAGRAGPGAELAQPRQAGTRGAPKSPLSPRANSPGSLSVGPAHRCHELSMFSAPSVTVG